MRTCIDRDSMQTVCADTSCGVSVKGRICNECYLPVRLVSSVAAASEDPLRPSTDGGKAFFEHCAPNPDCLYTLRHAPRTGSTAAKNMALKIPNPRWIQAWEQVARDSGSLTGDDTLESHNILLCDSTAPVGEGAPPKRPFRGAGVVGEGGPRIFIFDATTVPVYEYCGFPYQNTRLFFCVDEFGDSPHDATDILLFHCSDHILRQVCYAKSVQVRCEAREINVRFLQDMGTGWPDEDEVAAQLAGRLHVLFGELGSEPSLSSPMQPIVGVHRPVQVLSIQGRIFMDAIHRAAIEVFPTDELRIYNAIPGSGKSSALKAAVRAWPTKKILILVFNKSNQVALQHELRGRPGCVVKTLDALCAAAIPRKTQICPDEEMPPDSDSETEQTLSDPVPDLSEDIPQDDASAHEAEEQQEENEDEHSNPCEDDDDEELFDPVFSDSTFITAHFQEWNLKDKIKHGGGGGSASMVHNRLLHPRSVPKICKFHQRLTMLHMSDMAAGWDGCVESSPIKQIVDTKSTFSARKYICDRDRLLVSVFSDYDMVATDESQDLASALEMRLIQQAPCPLIMVGDQNQKINEFRHHVNGNFCSKNDKCCFPLEATTLQEFPTVEWYTTYRLCPLTVAFLEDATAIRMASTRTDAGNIYWQSTLAAPDTLILCRNNENVVKQAIKYQNNSIRVMSGGKIAGQLKAALASGGIRGMAGLAKKLAQDGILGSVLDMLVKQEINIEQVQKGGVLAVSTVHNTKGIEVDNTAVHSDVLEHARTEQLSHAVDMSERNVLLVSLSRHKKSLTILVDIPAPTPEPTGSAAKVQKTIGFAKIQGSEKAGLV